MYSLKTLSPKKPAKECVLLPNGNIAHRPQKKPPCPKKPAKERVLLPNGNIAPTSPKKILVPVVGSKKTISQKRLMWGSKRYTHTRIYGSKRIPSKISYRGSKKTVYALRRQKQKTYTGLKRPIPRRRRPTRYYGSKRRLIFRARNRGSKRPNFKKIDPPPLANAQIVTRKN